MKREKPANSASAARRLIGRVVRSDAGNVAVLFALALIPVVGGVGGAVDFSRAYVAKMHLLEAIDSAALAVGASQISDLDEMQQMAQKYFDANYDSAELGGGGTIQLSSDGNVITVNATTEIDTLLLGIMGMETIDVSAHTQVIKDSKALEIALVLDNTGSMGSNGKIGALKLASQSLVDILFGPEETHPKLKISLVPFSQTVNVGAGNRESGWMDVNALSSIHGENFSSGSTSHLILPAEPKYAAINAWGQTLGGAAPIKARWGGGWAAGGGWSVDSDRRGSWSGGVTYASGGSGGPVNVFSLFDGLGSVSWGGCVESRPEPYDTTDDAPGTSNPDTLFVPYFAPDEPDTSWKFRNDYLNDGISGSDQTRQAYAGKYQNASAGGYYGPNYGCNLPALTPLVNSKSALTSAIDGMVASGYTHIPLGLAWGWRTLSPSEPFSEGVAYEDEETNKALILLTDGYNTIPYQSTFNNSAYTAYGYVAEGRFGTTSYSTALSKLDPKTAEVCARVKDSGIRVYTITFQLSNGSIKDLMRDCASEPGLYFDSPSNEELQTTFMAIARDLSNLRISQ